jgi:hypothetical protein
MELGAKTSLPPMTPDFTREFPLEAAIVLLRLSKQRSLFVAASTNQLSFL